MRPPERLTVTEAAEKYVRLNNPGSYIGPYRSDMAQYMTEPADCLASMQYSAVIFVGSAQSGKTQSLILNWTAYSVKVDPMDMIVYSPTQSAARDFSMRRVGRMHRDSPEIGMMQLRDPNSDNKHDKHYKTGMILNLSWPSVSEFAGRPIGRVALTDYDRMPDDVDGDGNPFDLGSKRTTSFGSFAMTLAESTPSRPVTDPKWFKATAHEAPPCDGILGLYNRGDRRRWYWPCSKCGQYFEGGWKLLEWEGRSTILESAETVIMRCPINGCAIKPDDRRGMQDFGVWLKDGQSIDAEGNIVGNAVRSRVASFWVNGTAANFVTWVQLVTTYLTAMEQFDRTGSEDELKKFFNTDLGEPYIPKSAELERLPENLKSVAEPFPYKDASGEDRIERLTSTGAALEPLVPPDVRFLVACVDVQNNMFVVQVHGVGPGIPFDVSVIDRFAIKKSRRTDTQGDALWVKPGTYAEDWDEITTEVLNRSYQLSDGSTRRMTIRYTVCDSAGQTGATTNAYDYFRRLRSAGQSARFHLVKGDGNSNRPRTMITYPDSNQRGVKAAARGDVPVMILNSNALKDALVGRLQSVENGKGRFRFGNWLPDWWFAEMCAERRTDSGWERTQQKRNEGFDLSYYAIGALVSPLISAEFLNWQLPPNWADVWDKNSLVIDKAEKVAFAKPTQSSYDFSSFGKKLG